ncbi:MAG: acyl-CoA thioesterase [Rhodobiaceae bacterium]|nr:acyl-CoA thioesterase [Rhodobiaceae bacterium]|tara:strand:+ start:1438 stop:1878 length:441 start_codon:yes stop_codon:yes gene_type:complete
MTSDISGIIKQKTHFFQIRVFYEDTDFTGIVYHANYLKFAERGRTNFLRLLGVNHSELINSDEPKYFVVYKMNSKFTGTSTIDDILEVRSNFKGIEGVRLKIKQDIYKEEKKVFSANIEFALLDKNAKPIKFPNDMKLKIKNYLSK